MSSMLNLPHSLTSFLLLLILPSVFADPATVPYKRCSSQPSNVTTQLNVTTVYAQVLPNDMRGKYLNLTLIGESSQEIIGFSNSSSSLSTLFTTTSILTLTAWSNTTYLCSTLRPPSPFLNQTNASSCPIPAGPFAFSVTVPLGDHRSLTTLSTQLHGVDPFSNDLFCLDVLTTPLDPRLDSPYGQARIILWVTVALTIGYWVVVGIARIISALGRGITQKGLRARARSAGFILASAISGERLAASPALKRFCTPSMRDVIFHTQWCSALAMVAVQWPAFVYPILSQTAWSTLSYNITLTPGSGDHHWNPLATVPYSPPQDFADQLADPSSPIFVNPSAPNLIFTLPDNATVGISSFAYSVGLRPEDLFGNCLILFLGIIAATVAISALVWFTDHVANIVFGSNNVSPYPGLYTVGRIGDSRKDKDPPDATAVTPMFAEETKSQNGHLATLFRPNSRFNISSIASTGERGTGSYRAWWRFRSDINSFHGSVLHGNLVRILVLFHLPVTIFSCYHMTLPRYRASLSSIILAGLSFAFFSVLIPVHLLLRVTFTSTNKLYDETRTLLNYGALYNHYRQGSQMFANLPFITNLVFGVTIGVGQKSGTAQAIIILVVEVISAIITIIWLPWGSGDSMGLISFLFCVARIVMAVLLVILTPTISIGPGPAGWVAYGILVIMGLVFLALSLMLLVKLLEATVRIIGKIGFDRSRHAMDSGLVGVLDLLGCCGSSSGGRGRRRAKNRRGQKKVSNAYRASDSSDMPPLNARENVGVGIAQPAFLNPVSRKGSTTPPSVLRPEQALRPYREDSDDEGYIMGAWKPFASQQPGYTSVAESLPGSVVSNTSQKPTSGFSRVGGGRAHVDSPYAITHGGRASASMHTFPSIGEKHSPLGPGPSGLSNTVFYDDDESPPPSLSNIGTSGLPPGAMQPSHIRTKSQTAIIEDPGRLLSIMADSSTQRVVEDGTGARPDSSSGVAGFLRPRLSSFAAAMTGSGANNTTAFQAGSVASDAGILHSPDDDDDSERQPPKKKPWYFLRRHRPHTSDDSYRGPSQSADPEFGGLDLSTSSNTQPGRSFVVIRKNQNAGSSSGPSTTGANGPSGLKTGTATF
ncbi:hypothetical protein AX15_007253 [Amanita polypyramis BW_CC]|nr:hypothetical protein AX15_007253 [Amanita polypyramis BW_CC]